MYAHDESEPTGLIGETTTIEYPVDSLAPECINSSSGSTTAQTAKAVGSSEVWQVAELL